jgi:GT2 family glycosyltransferase
MHRISVITPSFRQLAWLKLCAASVEDQAGVEVEHIIQDAGTGPELEQWAAGHPQIKLAVEKDAGMYDAINRGLRRATGEICAYLNCDEQYLPGTLRRVADFFATHPEIDVLFGDAVLIDPAGRPLSYRRMVLPTALHTRLVHLGTLSAATFFRKSVVERGYLFDTQWKAIGDAVWVERLIRERIPMAVVRQPLSVFTFTGTNLGAQGVSQNEGARWRASKEAPPALLRWPTVICHRLRKLLAGAYSPKSCTLRHYTPDSPDKRKRFDFSGLRFSWPSEGSLSAEAPIAFGSAEPAEAKEGKPPKIAAVFSTCNRADLALACLEHLSQQTLPADRIYVADNASGDQTAAKIREQFGTRLPVQVISLEENLGNPAGIQVAMREALSQGADWVWILDDDAWPRPEALETLVRAGLNEQTVYSSLVIDPKANDLAWPYLAVRCEAPSLAMHLKDLPKGEDLFETKGAWLGALVPATIVREVGEVNPGLFIRGEDEDYPARIRAQGFRFLCVVGSVVEHPSPAKLVRFGLFGKNYFYEPRLPLWKAYYAVRNQVYVRKTYAANALTGNFFGIGSWLLSLVCCLALDDKKWARTGVHLKAGIHGLTGKLGKQVAPGP